MIHEPMTLATDYLLAGVGAVTGIAVLRNTNNQNSRRWWGIALLALALAAALGGTHHGFALQALWKPTVFIAGAASPALVTGLVYATTRGSLRHAMLVLVALNLALFLGWTWHKPWFICVVADSGD